MSETYDAMEAHGIEPHPEGDKFDPGAWDRPARCICGLALPPQREWCGAGLQWQHIACPTCQRAYVDEDDFFAIYDEPIDCEDCCQHPTVDVATIGEREPRPIPACACDQEPYQ